MQMMRQMWAGVVLVVMLAAAGVVRAEDGLTVAGPDAPAFKPYRGLTYTPEGVERVREVARTTERGRALAEAFFATAETWLAFSPQELADLVPEAEEIYARGYAGDPKTGAKWPPHGRSDDMCSLDRPRTVRSPFTGDIYGGAAPGEPYYDDGTGWTRPDDGKTFYFRGIWNSWFIATLLDAVDDMAIAYMLSGDERVAQRALDMLDAVATLRANRGDDRGPVDDVRPYEERRPHSGFFHYRGNGANDRVYKTLFALDLLAASPHAHQPSSDRDGLTIFENVREHYVHTYEKWYLENLHTFYNHVLVLYANDIAQAVLFGDPELLREGIDAVYGFLDNAITRDGDYFENAAGYNEVGVNYAAKMILPLSNYDPANYDEPSRFPDPASYPMQMKFGNDARWRAATILLQYRPIIFGRKIQYGDYYPDRTVSGGDEMNKWVAKRRAEWLRLLSQQTERATWKEQFAHLFHQLPEAWQEEADVVPIRDLGMSQWFSPEKPDSDAEQVLADLPTGEDSDLQGARVFGILRSGEGDDARALFMRGGVNTSHGHDDQMGIILYARKMSLTGLFGYRFAGTPDHFGWGTRAISHKTVTVDQDLPPQLTFKHGPPADLVAFVPKLTDQPQSAQILEMSNPRQWRHVARVSQYQRGVWQVDVSDDQFYFVDMFRVRGGTTHDYAWTGPYPRTGPAHDAFAITGVTPESVDGIWTLAGFDPQYRDAVFDNPELSWGERLDVNSGFIRESDHPDDVVNNVMRWNPPPGNGYGFIWDVKQDRATGPWSAMWDLLDGRSRMRLTMLTGQGQQVITGKSPALENGRHHAIVVARRQTSGDGPLRSRFLSITEVGDAGDTPTSGIWPIRSAHLLEPQGVRDSMAPVSAEIDLEDGRRDVILTTVSDEPIAGGGVELSGKRGFVRFDEQDRPQELMLQEGRSLRAGDVAIHVPREAWRGEVVRVEATPESSSVVLSEALPSGSVLLGHGLLFNEPTDDRRGYTHNQYYEIHDVISQGGQTIVDTGPQSLVGTRIDVEKVDDEGLVHVRWPNEMIGHRHTRYFAGREAVVVDDPSRTTRVTRFTTNRTLTVNDPDALRPGDKVALRMVQAGDVFSIPTLVVLTREDVGRWELQSNQPVSVRLPAQANQRLVLETPDGQRHVLRPAAGDAGAIEADVPLELMPAGRATLTLESAR